MPNGITVRKEEEETEAPWDPRVQCVTSRDPSAHTTHTRICFLEPLHHFQGSPMTFPTLGLDLLFLPPPPPSPQQVGGLGVLSPIPLFRPNSDMEQFFVRGINSSRECDDAKGGRVARLLIKHPPSTFGTRWEGGKGKKSIFKSASSTPASRKQIAPPCHVFDRFHCILLFLRI